VVLRPTPHKTGHFGDAFPSQSVRLVWKKLNLTQQKHAFTNQKKCTTTQKIKPGLVAFYDIQPGNGAGTFTKESTSTGGGGDMEGKIEEKRISGEATIQASRKYTNTKNQKSNQGRIMPRSQQGALTI